jgi:HEAT repeat protein
MDEIERLLAEVLSSDTEASRNAIAALERSGDSRAVKVICHALRTHRSPYVRARATGALERFRDPSSIPALTAALRDDNIDAAQGAVWALAAIGPRPLLRALETIPEMWFNYVESLEPDKVLVRCGPEAVEPLLEALRTSNETIRCIAAKVLGEIGDSRALPELDRMSRDNFSPMTIEGSICQEIARRAAQKIRSRGQ